MRPGVDVISRALPPPRSAPTDTGVAFVVGATGGTSLDPYGLVHSMTEYEALFGLRTDGPATYDWADVYFREGGGKLYVARAAAGAARRGAKESDDDEAAPRVVDAGIVAALDSLNKSLGPGQVAIADPALAADAANQSALTAHAAANNRVALLTCADGPAAGLIAAGEALITDANGRYGALFAPSAVVPGMVAGTTRTVPYSAVEAGIIARNDSSYTPNQAAAGVWGQAVYAIDLAGTYTDLEYQNLNDACVSMARMIYGGVRTYGYRSCVDPVATPEWLDFGWSRLNMQIVAQAENVGERYMFSQIDGRGITIADFGSELSAILAPLYDAGSLYGNSAEEAFAVDVGSTVNTEATIANGELHAILLVRMSPDTEWVVIEITKVATTESLPGVPPPGQTVTA